MIKKALEEIKTHLPAEVTLVAVSKTKPNELIQEAYDAGQRDFGENRPQEMQKKAAALPSDIRWHFIGHLQTNKVKYIIDKVHLIHSVDSIHLLEEIERQAMKAGRKVNCLLQVHIASEEHKFGFTPEEVKRFFKEGSSADFPHVEINGLMGMATFTEDNDLIRNEFRTLNKVYQDIVKMVNVNNQTFSMLSMGMSGDYLIAIEEGSTMVRIGSSIFGKR